MTSDMTGAITGGIDNGGVGRATIGGFTGPVGISRQPGSNAIELALRDQGTLSGGPIVVTPIMRRSQRDRPLAIVLPIAGSLDGRPMTVIKVRRSDLDQQIVIATVEIVAE